MGWFSTALKVAQIGGQILASLPIAAEDSASGNTSRTNAYNPGGVSAYWDHSKNEPVLKNVTDVPVAVNYVKNAADTKDGSNSFAIELQPGEHYNPQPELSFYRNGDLTVFDAPNTTTETDQHGDPLLAVVACSGALLVGGLIGVAYKVSAGIRKTDDGYEFYIRNEGGRHLQSISASLTTGTVTLDFEKKASDLTDPETVDWIFPIPQGVDMSAGAKLNGQIGLTVSAYREMVAPNRHRVQRAS